MFPCQRPDACKKASKARQHVIESFFIKADPDRRQPKREPICFYTEKENKRSRGWRKMQALDVKNPARYRSCPPSNARLEPPKRGRFAPPRKLLKRMSCSVSSEFSDIFELELDSLSSSSDEDEEPCWCVFSPPKKQCLETPLQGSTKHGPQRTIASRKAVCNNSTTNPAAAQLRGMLNFSLDSINSSTPVTRDSSLPSWLLADPIVIDSSSDEELPDYSVITNRQRSVHTNTNSLLSLS